MKEPLHSRRIWKRLACLAAMLFCVAAAGVPALAQEAAGDSGSGQSGIPEEWAQVTQEAPMTAGDFSGMTLSDWLEKGAEILRESLHEPLRLLARLCGLVLHGLEKGRLRGLLLLAAVGKSMCTERTSPELAGLVDTVVTLAVFTLCSSCMLALTGVLQDAIETSRVYIISFVPVFASVLTACGQVGGAALYSGFFFGAAMVMADILCRVGLPLTRVLLALNATAAVGSTLDLSQLTASVCRWTKWLLTFCATVFGALIGLQGIFAQSADTLALKTGKFLLSSGVPVVGRAISDAMGSVLAGLKMLKGTVGFAVIAVIAASFLPLLIQCCAYHLVFSAGNIVASATGGTKSAKLLSGFSDCVSLYISMVVFFSLIVISSTLVMILLGNGG